MNEIPGWAIGAIVTIVGGIASVIGSVVTYRIITKTKGFEMAQVTEGIARNAAESWESLYKGSLAHLTEKEQDIKELNQKLNNANTTANDYKMRLTEANAQPKYADVMKFNQDLLVYLKEDRTISEARTNNIITTINAQIKTLDERLTLAHNAQLELQGKSNTILAGMVSTMADIVKWVQPPAAEIDGK